MDVHHVPQSTGHGQGQQNRPHLSDRNVILKTVHWSKLHHELQKENRILSSFGPVSMESSSRVGDSVVDGSAADDSKYRSLSEKTADRCALRSVIA